MCRSLRRSAALSPQAITRSESVVFFASAADRGGIYAYGGERPTEISEQLRYVFQNLITPELIWAGWLDRKLLVTLPWTYEDGPTSDSAALFVFDPSVGERGAWAYHTSTQGSLGPLVAGSNTDSAGRPMAVLRNTEHPCVVKLNAIEQAADLISKVAVLGGTGPDSYILTGDDAESAEIVMSGMPGYAEYPTYYKTPWIHAGWPTRKKSWRRPDFVCRDTGSDYELQVRSYRDYEESQPKRQYNVQVLGGSATTRWGDGSTWTKGTLADNKTPDPNYAGPIWGAGDKTGGMIRRGSSFGMCRAIQLRIEGGTAKARWGLDAVILKLVLRRFR